MWHGQVGMVTSGCVASIVRVRGNTKLGGGYAGLAHLSFISEGRSIYMIKYLLDQMDLYLYKYIPRQKKHCRLSSRQTTPLATKLSPLKRANFAELLNGEGCFGLLDVRGKSPQQQYLLGRIRDKQPIRSKKRPDRCWS